MIIRSYTVRLSGSHIEMKLDLDVRNKKEAQRIGRKIAFHVADHVYWHYMGMKISTKVSKPRINVIVEPYKSKV